MDEAGRRSSQGETPSFKAEPPCLLQELELPSLKSQLSTSQISKERKGGGTKEASGLCYAKTVGETQEVLYLLKPLGQPCGALYH